MKTERLLKSFFLFLRHSYLSLTHTTYNINPLLLKKVDLTFIPARFIQCSYFCSRNVCKLVHIELDNTSFPNITEKYNVINQLHG